METRAHYVAIGAFVVALVFLAFTAVLWLAGTQFSVSYQHYDIFFKGAVTGLSKGAQVAYNGIPVGQVSDIEIDPGNVEQIRVTVEVKSDVVVKTDARAEIASNILSGVSTILITRGTQEAPRLVGADGHNPVIQARRSTLASLSARGPELLNKLDDILDEVNDLLNVHNRDALAATLDHIQKITAALDAQSDTIGKTITDADKTIMDADETVKKIGSLAENLDKSWGPNGLKDQLSELIKGLIQMSHQLTVVLEEARPGVHTFSTQTLADVDSLVGDARHFIAGLSRLSAEIERDPTRFLFGDRREGYQPK
jgi:phospholipid/cholesterol/gamma-HCH transport system substrate-binding protein